MQDQSLPALIQSGTELKKKKLSGMEEPLRKVCVSVSKVTLYIFVKMERTTNL
ncbi:hypothetical protein EXN66_Car019003 [Channa argus]|uniref:Uncharacterized protein n=1 Tax=Channa argus TaxID=215402 RepID=A0A6G1QL84_CHAAH|nr:hypothetical protein EXN66_Car019003 [Channa argus]